MMYYRDFERLAEAFLSVKSTINHREAEVMRTRLMAAVENVCLQSNNRFDSAQFEAACAGTPYTLPRRQRRRSVIGNAGDPSCGARG